MGIARFVRGLKLEGFSARFARKLLERHPEWQAYAGHHEEGDDGLRYLEMRVPSENPNYPEPLLILTRPHRGRIWRPGESSRPFDGREVFIEWAGPHVHFLWTCDRPETDLFDEALAEIDRWVSDDYIFAAEYKDDHVACAGGWPAGQEPPRWAQPEPGRRMVLRSWRGTHDREL